MPYLLLCLQCFVPCMLSCIVPLHALVPHMSCALRVLLALRARALRALAPYVPCVLRILAPHELHLLQVYQAEPTPVHLCTPVQVWLL